MGVERTLPVIVSIYIFRIIWYYGTVLTHKQLITHNTRVQDSLKKKESNIIFSKSLIRTDCCVSNGYGRLDGAYERQSGHKHIFVSGC